MGLAYTPQIKAGGAGAELINTRLMQWQRVDSAGSESDRLTVVVENKGVDGMPSDGARISWSEGYKETGMADKGAFRISRTTPQLYPHAMRIVATAAPFEAPDQSGFRERRTASYGPDAPIKVATLGELFEMLVSRHGFSPRVGPEMGSIPITHLDQSEETDMAFLSRVAALHDGMAKPFDQLYVLAKRGTVKSVSGQSISPVTLSVPQNNEPANPGFVSASIDRTGRRRYKGVTTTWWDDEKGEEQTEQVGGAPFKRIRQQYESQGAAKEAASGEQLKLVREDAKIRIDAPGDPKYVAEGLLTLDGTWPSYMQGEWSIDKVTARGDKRGYRCLIEATLPD